MTCTMEPLHPLPSSSRWSHFPVRMSSVKARRQRKEPRPVERAASLQETVDNLARVPLLPPEAGGAASPGSGVPPPEPFWLRCGACKTWSCRPATSRPKIVVVDMTGGPNNSERQAFIEVPEARDPAGAARSEPTISRTTRPKGTTSWRATRRAARPCSIVSRPSSAACAR
jgi:hypothetical protein